MPSKTRFRTIKKLHKHKSSPNPLAKPPQNSPAYSPLATAQAIFLARRLKALLVDVFMIYTPIVYLSYIILGGAQEFRSNQPVIFICFLLYACICAIFIARSGQTPGLRYVGLKLVGISYPESTQTEVGFWRAFVRMFVWAFSCAVVVGFVAPFFAKSRQCLHDSLMHTRLIDTNKPQGSGHQC